MTRNVLVIGAGPVGLCLSLALARRGLDVDLVEQQSAELLAAPAFDGREIALDRASRRLLRELGVWERIPSDGIAPVSRARIMDGAGAGFEINGEAFGQDGLGVLVSNHLIRTAAWQAAAKQPRVRVHTGVSVDSVSIDAVTARARLADGGVLEAPLLVAADGRFSGTRRSMGIAAHMRDFGASMLACRMRHAQANDGTAWEWFGRGQTRALLPLGEHLSSVVLTLPDREARELVDLSPGALAEEIAARYEGRLGAMQLASTVHRYPLVATWAHRFVAKRFALAGDAAVGMHPVTAHGFNLGLASVEHLAEAAGAGLQRYGDPAHPALLARYQRRQRMSSALLFAGTQTLVGVFTSSRGVMQPLRQAVMQAGRKLPVLRRALAASVLDGSPRPATVARHVRTIVDVLRPRLRASAKVYP
ncbi:MAG: FAD-dependent hydroxylase [Rhodanobacteraceae bacterium]|nr:MAG: FAD-dependent hydroxylase [Rhodanobacteraceae bacterium]